MKRPVNFDCFKSAIVPMLFAMGMALPNPAALLAAQSVGISTTRSPQAMRPVMQAMDACPRYNGLIRTVSVPVSKQASFYLVTSNPVQAGGASFQLSSDDPSVAAVGDIKQAFLPIITIPQGQTASNPFTVFGVGVGATLLRVTPLSTGFYPFEAALNAWDVNPGGQQKFVDANPPSNHCRVDNASGELSTDTGVRANCGEDLKEGIAADGASPLLLRTVSGLPGTACFSITSSSSSDQGTLQTPVVDTESLDDREYAFSYYTAPDTFGDTADYRTLEVEFTFTPSPLGEGNTSSFRATTRIVRPPVLLVHGLWGSDEAWSSDFIKEDDFHTTDRADYSYASAASFSVNSPRRIQNFVKDVIERTRGKGYTVTQTDVMGHSMGGILTRLYMGGDQFQRPDNFGKGDIRRLLTLDTPHGGSTFANLIIALHRARPAEIEQTIDELLHASPAGGALCDLAENSPALTGLSNSTPVLAQAITGTGGPAVGSYDEGSSKFIGDPFGLFDVEGELTRTRCLHKTLLLCDQEEYVFPQDTVNGFRFRQANDATVALASQQGGLAGVNFPNVVHDGPSIFGITHGVVQYSAVANRAYQLLDGPSSAFTSGFPGVNSTGSGVPSTVPGRGAAQDQQDYADECGFGGPLSSAAALRLAAAQQTPTPDSRARITTPANGQVFAPGDTVDITVKLNPPFNANEIQIDRKAFSIGWGGGSSLKGENYDGTQYQASFAIPQFYVGPMVFTPSIWDENNVHILGLPTAILIKPKTLPLSIEATNRIKYFTLPDPYSWGRLTIQGHYSGPVRYNISSAVLGTQYQSSNPAVVQVNSEGDYQVMGTGTAVITATNSGLKTFVNFVVDDPAHPLQPTDVSAQFSVQQGGFRLDRNTGLFVQSVVVKNLAPIPVSGPLNLLISGLPAGIRLVNNSATSRQVEPGSPYFMLHMGPDGINVQPGESTTLTLQFLNPTRNNISYHPTVWQKVGQYSGNF